MIQEPGKVFPSSLSPSPQNTKHMCLSDRKACRLNTVEARGRQCFRVWEGFEWRKHVVKVKDKLISMSSLFFQKAGGHSVSSIELGSISLTALQGPFHDSGCPHKSLWWLGNFCNSKQFVLFSNLYVYTNADITYMKSDTDSLP